MEVSLRAFMHRILTYPILSIIMIVYALAENKRKILDAFYFVRGFPHGFVKDGNRVAFYDGLVLVFPFGEDPSFDDVWLRDVYYPYKPRSDDVVIDVGAHMGFFTLKIAKYVKEVVAIEPDPTNFKFLTLNIQLNNLENKVVSCHFALGARNGRTYLNRRGYGFGRSKTTTMKTDYLVEIRTLDSIVQEIGIDQVNLVKIDTEGNELEVLEGARRTLKDNKPDLLIAAYHFDQEHLAVANYLRNFGYDTLYYRVPLFLSLTREIYVYAKHRIQPRKRL